MNEQIRRHLAEDALQAYVRRRLEDLLPFRIPGVQIKIHREPQVKYQRRFDLEVVAPTIERQLASVVIEIKWSDNPETLSGMEKQLVTKYLLGHQLDRGIYLVGWCGECNMPGKDGKDIEKLRAHLASCAKAAAANTQLANLKVEPVVLDLRGAMTCLIKPPGPLLEARLGARVRSGVR